MLGWENVHVRRKGICENIFINRDKQSFEQRNYSELSKLIVAYEIKRKGHRGYNILITHRFIR